MTIPLRRGLSDPPRKTGLFAIAGGPDLMQDDRGVKGIFQIPKIYSLFQNLIGVQNARRWWIRNILRPQPGEKVIDIGCGLGDVLDHLPEVEYYGIDISEQYSMRPGGDMAVAAFFCTETPKLVPVMNA